MDPTPGRWGPFWGFVLSRSTFCAPYIKMHPVPADTASPMVFRSVDRLSAQRKTALAWRGGVGCREAVGKITAASKPDELPGLGDCKVSFDEIRSAMLATMARPSPLPSVPAVPLSKRRASRPSASVGTTGPSLATRYVPSSPSLPRSARQMRRAAGRSRPGCGR